MGRFPPMSAPVKDVDSAGFGAEVVERSYRVPVLVDFWAAWCGPCKVLGPTLEKLAEEGGGAWELVKVDVDQNQQLAAEFGVQGIPTVVAFKDGQAVNRFTGALGEAQVRAFIESILPSRLDLAAEQGLLLLEAGDEFGAEAAFGAVLTEDPAHEEAGIGLAGIHLDRGEREKALAVLERLAQTDAVKQMAAIARLSVGADLAALEEAASGGTAEARLELAVGLAAGGEHERAMEILVDLVALREPPISEKARLTLLDLFEILGPDNRLTGAYRRRLANALF